MSTDATRSVVRIVDEATFGVTPTTPAFQTLQLVTTPNMTFTPLTKTSAALVADRNIADLIRVGIEAGGDITMEASYKGLDPVLRPAMMSDWIRWPVRDNSATAASNITGVDGAGVYTFLATAGTELNDHPFVVGMLMNATGFGVAANNQLARVTAVSATMATVATSSVEASPPAYARLKAVGIQGVASDITATAGPNTLATTLLNFATLGIIPGMWLFVGGTASGVGFATAANKDWVRVQTVTATLLTLDIVPAGWTTDTGSGKTIQLFVGDVIRNGTTPRSTAVEIEYSDLSPVQYDLYNGCRWGIEFTSAPQDIMHAKATMMGTTATNGTARFAGATTLPAPTNDVINTSSHYGEIRVNNVLVGAGPNWVDAISIKLDNMLRRQKAIGSLYDIGIGLGQANVTGSLSFFYGDAAVRTLVLAGTALGYSNVLFDPTLQAAYHFDIPRLKFVSGTPTIPGINTDRKLVTPFQGLKHAALGYAFQLSRFDYLPL